MIFVMREIPCLLIKQRHKTFETALKVHFILLDSFLSYITIIQVSISQVMPYIAVTYSADVTSTLYAI